MDSNEPYRNQHIGNISTGSGGQTFAGHAGRDVIFYGSENSEDVRAKAIKACRNALFLADPAIDRAGLISAKGKRVTSTCEWIREDGTYQSWLRGEVPLLWICGGPGKGKTMLSIFLIEDLEQDRQVVYYFCSSEDEKRSSAVTVLRGLLWQITTRLPELTERMLDNFDTPEKARSSLDSPETLWTLFARLCRDTELDGALCILDGLDECDEKSRSWLVEKLVDFATTESGEACKNALKIVVVSRSMLNFRGSAQINLDPDNDEAIGVDIQKFIATRVQELSQSIGFDSGFRLHIEKTLLERAGGTFLWVGFAMIELRRKRTRVQIEESLGSLPSGLPAIYGRMLLHIEASIEARHTKIVSRILQWVTLAVRPLSLPELAAAVGCEHTPMLRADQVIRDRVADCSPFLVVNREHVGLVHQSARDYLLRENEDENATLELFRIKLEESHLQLAKRCLDHLQASAMQDWSSHSNEDEEVADDGTEDVTPRHGQHVDSGPRELASKIPFLWYAISYWPAHARSASVSAERLMDHPSGFFHTYCSSFEKWWVEYSKITPIGAPSSRGRSRAKQSRLHIACYLGIVAWVRAILAKRKCKVDVLNSINKKDPDGCTGLIYAASQGHEAVVKVLLDTGADVASKDRDGWQALAWASSSNHKAVVQLLLSSKADINAKDDTGSTVLHMAAFHGYEEVVRLLLDRKADIDAKDDTGSTVLHMAASHGYEEVVRLLLGRKADIDAKDKHGSTALGKAAGRRKEEIVRLLLDSKADVNARDNQRWTALYKAAIRGHKGIVRLLLASKADVNAKTKDGQTALTMVAKRGHEEMVQLLLDSKADVNAKNTYGQTALHFAAYYGHAEIARLLLDYGADVDPKDDTEKPAYSTQLQKTNMRWCGYCSVAKQT
ncbi:hypothetical protein LTR37_001647 [Vermiconidia calcicola]|uniref:Uncharacterized protein n=1 Tax=Vermiconidia calcicola TaxID=1690605 RepID=A0ACC3NVS2_9PEZI|nr:hypothetical protein LTR37_001647 [Vermiconidia calcicola]